MKNVFKVKRNYWYFAGMLVGVAAIICGIFISVDASFYSSSIDYSRYGADFYTDIYNATRSINYTLSSIGRLSESITQGIGISFILFGLADICLFGGKLKASAEKPVPPKNINVENPPSNEDVNSITMHF